MIRVREQRFWSKVDKSAGPDGCWLWIGAINASGYGNFQVARGTTRKAHRLAYELLVGEIPAGLVLDHLCRERCCVNPAHLEPVTHAENVRRGLHGALRTHCAQGHELTADNVSLFQGRRRCLACKREDNRRRRAEQRRIRERSGVEETREVARPRFAGRPDPRPLTGSGLPSPAGRCRALAMKALASPRATEGHDHETREVPSCSAS